MISSQSDSATVGVSTPSRASVIQDDVLIASCVGLCLVPADQVADYYRAHGYAAAPGIVLLLMWIALQLVGLVP